MNRYVLALLILILSAVLPADAFLFNTIGNASMSSIPTVVAGTDTPLSEDNVHPSMSRTTPRCFDATWGAGCNTATQKCIQPTGGAPLQTCQPPLQLVVTGGTGNGTSATINYTSYAGFAFPVGSPLNVSGATQTAWNTPLAHVTSYSQANSGCSGTDPCVTLGYASTPFISGDPIYVSELAGNGQAANGANAWNYGFGNTALGGTGCAGLVGTYNSATGALCISLASAAYGTTPTNGLLYQFALTFSIGSCPATSCSLNTLPLALASSSGGGTVLNFNAPTGFGSLTISGGSILSMSLAAGPNNKWTPSSISTTSVSYDVVGLSATGFGGGYASNNGQGYNGLLYEPWVVTASSCVGSSCSVSFNHPTSCASNCVSATTQIVAGQFDATIMAWDTGPAAPFAVETGTVTKCISAHHLSHGSTTGPLGEPVPMRYVGISLDGGAFAVATTPVLDPFGIGAASTPNDPDPSLVGNHTVVYCAQFAASSVADGLHEMQAIACPIAGYCAQLSSEITGDATTSNATIQSNGHGMSDTYRLGIVSPVDTAFKPYNDALNNSAITITGVTQAAHVATYSFTQPTNIPSILPGALMNITGVTTSNSCSVTGGSSNGATETMNFTVSGGCLGFATGSEVNVSGVTVAAQASGVASSFSYVGTTLSITIPSATWGTAPGNNVYYSITGATGTNAASINTNQVLISNSGSGTVFNFTVASGLSFSCSACVLHSNTYTWNTSLPAVVTASSAGSITLASLSTAAWSSGGTITENWNDHCINVEATATSGAIKCNLNANGNTATTWVSGGSIQINSNMYCVIGGAGDNPTPYNPAYVSSGSLTSNTFELSAYLSDTCSPTANFTGCRIEPCGILPSQNSTLWFYRHDAGTQEQINIGRTVTSNTGSLWIYTNSGGTIQAKSAYVDPLLTTAATSGCSSAHAAAAAWNATPPTYAGTYCGNVNAAKGEFVWNGTAAAIEIPGTSGSCTTFTNRSGSSNTSLYVGEPIIFQGLDSGPTGDGTGATFANFALYWVQSNTAGVITLATTPGGACISNTVAANIFTSTTTPTLEADIGFDNVYVKCNTGLGCSTSNPAYMNSGITFAAQTAAAISGWFSLLPDTGNGTTQHQVDLTFGQGAGGFALTGRIREGLDRSQPAHTFATKNTIGPFPGAPSGLPGVITVTGGSFSGTCPGAACTETLTYTVADVTGSFGTNPPFQVPDATNGAPGETLTVTNSGNADYACTGCNVTASTSGSVSFLNTTSNGSAYSGTAVITPIAITVEVAPCTFPGPSAGCNDNAGTANCANSSGNPVALTGGETACVMGTTRLTFNGTNKVYGVITDPTGGTVVMTSSCLPTSNGAQPQYPVHSPFITAVTPSPDGVKNDLITLSGSTGAPLWAYNQCPATLVVTNGQFVGSGSTDGWDSGNTISGPNILAISGIPSQLLKNNTGLIYDTNLTRYGTASAMNVTSYNWGTNSIYNTGSAFNNVGVSFHSRVVANSNMAPPSLVDGGFLSQIPAQIKASFDTWAHYQSNTPMQMNGGSCIAGGGGTNCIAASSRIYTVNDLGGGSIPSTAVPGWLIYNLLCGVYPPGTVAPATINTATPNASTSIVGNVLATWFDQTHTAFALNTAPSATCTDVSTAAVTWYIGFHGDLNFNALNQNNTPAEKTNYNEWQIQKDMVFDDNDWAGSGSMEGQVYNGGTRENLWFGHGTIQIINFFGSGGNGGGLKSVTFYCCTPQSNVIEFNSNLYGVNNAASDNLYWSKTGTFPRYLASNSDVFFINDNVGAAPGFPYNLQYRPNYGAYTAFNYIGQDFAGNQAADFPAGFGPVVTSTGLWPSEAIAVDANGNPSVAGSPGYNSLKSCPWYCTATDTGLGLY